MRQVPLAWPRWARCHNHQPAEVLSSVRFYWIQTDKNDKWHYDVGSQNRLILGLQVLLTRQDNRPLSKFVYSESVTDKMTNNYQIPQWQYVLIKKFCEEVGANADKPFALIILLNWYKNRYDTFVVYFWAADFFEYRKSALYIFISTIMTSTQKVFD